MIRVAESRADFERCAEIYNAVELDRVVDLGAPLEVRAALGDADHPDRFSFPCFFA